jgi:hypothetical protein
LQFFLDDLDVDDFVHAWSRHLATGRVTARDLLTAAIDDAAAGGYFLISNVGPKAGFAFPAKEQLVLYAVLAVYQDVDLRWMDEPWQGTDRHVQQAFAYANQLGRSGVARVLLERVAERSATHRPPPPQDPLLPAPSGDSPGDLAAYDRAVAAAIDRDIRAAAVLDPNLSLDSILLGEDPWGHEPY